MSSVPWLTPADGNALTLSTLAGLSTVIGGALAARPPDTACSGRPSALAAP